MIDLHTHILPCMDDGSASAEESEQMLRELRRQGVEILVATPHYYAHKETPQEFLRRRRNAYERMQWKDKRLLLGAEVAYFSGISHCQQLPMLCIQGAKLLLLEMPFSSWNHTVVDEVCAIYRRLGVSPVLAHIERYRKLPNFYESIVQFLQCGVYLQCNAETILSPFAGRRLIRMIREGAVHFLGSDCHDMTRRPPNMGRAIEKLKKKIGTQRFQAFCDTARELLEL